MVVGHHTGGVCSVNGLSSCLEEHSSGFRCFRSDVGLCSCRSRDVVRVVSEGGLPHNCTQRVDGLRVHRQEQLGLPDGQAGHLARGQSECQTSLHQPGLCERPLALQESGGSSSPVARALDPGSASVREVTTSHTRRLSQQKEADSGLASAALSRSETLPLVRSARDRSDGNQFVLPTSSLLHSHSGRGSIGHGQHGTGLGQVLPQLLLSPSHDDGIGPQQDPSVQFLNDFSGRVSLETQGDMVSQGSAIINISSTQISRESQDSGGSGAVLLSSQHTLWQRDEICRLEAFWSGRNKGRGLSSRAEFIVQSGWAEGTKSVYGLGYRYYVEFCRKHQMDPLVPDPVTLLNFLTFYFEVKNSEYRTLNCYRSAVSSTLSNNPATGLPVGQDPLVSRFFRGVRRLRPPKTKLFPSWSISTVLQYLKTLGDSKSLSLDVLLLKTCFLVCLVCCKRPACLRNMKKVPGYWELSMAGFRCQTLGMSKTEVHHVSPPIVIDPFLEDPQLCPVFHLVRLDKLLDKVRQKDVTDFWLSAKKPNNPVSTQTLCRWLKKVIMDSGALVGSARDVRSVGSSTAAQAGLDIGRILEAGDWRRLQTFQSHYFKPQRLQCISSILRVVSN